MNTRKWLIILATFIVCIGLGMSQAFAAVSSINNNFTMLDPGGGLTGGSNDVVFTWDGTLKTSVVASGQVSNATLTSVTPFYGVAWAAHDVTIYGPGTYTVYDGCPVGGPGCGTGNAITFTVATGQLGVHMLFDWGGNNDIDVVNIWVPNAVFGPSPMYPGPDGTISPYGNPATVWSYASIDWNGDGFNGFGMTDGPFLGFNANFNVNVVGTANNNFTMLDPANALVGGTNDILFTWNGTKKTSVAVSGQVSNATISAITPLFYGVAWLAHDVAIYGPGTYTVYPDCPAGSPGCGAITATPPITFTVAAGKLGAHMLFDWGGSYNIDVVDIWTPNAVFGPSPIFTGPDGGTVNPAKIWDWMSSDWNGDGINGYPMVDGQFLSFSANFNVMGVPPVTGCVPADCNDNNACTLDVCVGSTCVHTAINCDDGNICTTDSCNTSTGCVHTAAVPASCDDNNICTIDGCTNNACTHTATVPASCNDNNACTTDTCSNNTCGHTPITCNDNNPCTTDSCNTATGCVFAPPGTCPLSSTLNNFTMVDPTGKTIGGTNDVVFAWDGTKKTSVAASGQASNAIITSTCPFQGIMWSAHDVAIYGPGTYTVYTGCAAGSPGCGTGTPYTFTVGTGQLGGHILFNWGASANIDVVDVWVPNAVFGPSALWTGACGSQVATKVWDLMSNDSDGDGINGKKLVDGPFLGFNPNFNLMVPCPTSCNDNNACTVDSCVAGTCVNTPITCNDNSACTTDTCNTATGCVYTPIVCNDNNACTADTCNTATGCVFTTIVCNDNNACTTDTCNTATGCVYTPIVCNDNNACTADTCNTATGCVYTPIVCNDNNACTTDTCNTVTGCVYTPIVCNDNNICTTDTCNTATGCVFTATVPASCNDNNACTTDGCTANACTHVSITCNDNNACTTDTCNTATGCVYTPIVCNDNNACTTDTCNTATGCIYTPIVCNDNNICTTDICNTATGCVFTATIPASCNDNNACTTDGCTANACTHTTITCNDNNACTTDTCNTATGCVYTPIVCNDNNACTTDTCNTATGCVYTPIVCNDNNICTTDTCNTATGCVFTATIPASCNDNNACTTDGCTANACTHTTITCNDNNACTTDSCNTATGCVYTPISCNDNNPCTTDTCNTTTGCIYTPIVCNDGNACTIDACGINGCIYAPINCDDGNACTVDSCNPATGCVHTPIVCNDGNSCTTDTCVAGVCTSTANNAVCPATANNNFTMLDPTNNIIGGTNDVVFAWDGTKKTSVAASGQVSNALLTSTCPFYGATWSAHDVTVYGPGTYTVYADCAAGSPGCGTGAPLTFTVKAGEIGAHMLFDWNGELNIDVVNVLKPNSTSSNMFTGSCGSNTADTIWTWDSYDIDGDGINGIPMVDGPFLGMNANFNLIKIMDPCFDAATRCNDNNACTVDTCNSATGACINTAKDCNDNNACTVDSCNTTTGACANTVIVCNDNNACTDDSCNTATGCVYTARNCNDNNACTMDVCDTATGCVHYPMPCSDNNACTADTCNSATGCVFTPIVCNDNNACTIDSCNTLTGCVFTAKNCNDNNACTTDSCNTATGACVNTAKNCNDNNACTIDSCDTVTGACVYTPVVCNDNSLCTTDTCAPATGCVYTPISCDDGNACTTDTCVASTGCVHTSKVCNDNNVCTADSCNTATGACVYTPVANGTGCTQGSTTGTCQSGTCTSSTCPAGSYKTVKLRGTGSNYSYWKESQIQTQFTVSGSGCILRYTASTLTATPGTILKVDWKKGTGPNPTSVTWKGSAIPAATVPYTITCPSKTGTVGSLVLSNTSASGGRDTDTLTISVANN